MGRQVRLDIWTVETVVHSCTRAIQPRIKSCVVHRPPVTVESCLLLFGAKTTNSGIPMASIANGATVSILFGYGVANSLHRDLIEDPIGLG